MQRRLRRLAAHVNCDHYSVVCLFVTNARFAFSRRVPEDPHLFMSSLLYMNIDVFCEVIKYLDPIQVLVTMSPLTPLL